MSELIEPLIQSGILGAILAWFMLRLEGIIKDNTAALNSMQLTMQKMCDQFQGAAPKYEVQPK